MKLSVGNRTFQNDLWSMFSNVLKGVLENVCTEGESNYPALSSVID